MLSHIKLNNFKSFQKLEKLEIKPITILCGTNSCGKSSILQSLLLFKQSKESRNPNQSLLLNGKYVHLGNIENIIYGMDKEKELSVSYGFEFTLQQLKQTSKNQSNIPAFRYLLDKDALRMAKHSIQLDIRFKVSSKKKGYIHTADILRYEISVVSHSDSGNLIPGAKITINKDDSLYSLKWENLPDFLDQIIPSGTISKVSIDFENLFPVIEFKNNTKDLKLIEKFPIGIRGALKTFDIFLNRYNEGIAYIGPLREEPARRYIYENEVLEIGIKGENAAYIYQTEQDIKIEDHYFFDDNKRNKFSKLDSISLKDSLTKWLELMDIKKFKPANLSEIIQLQMISNSSPGTFVNIADVGFGVSQVFPILLEGLRKQKNSTLLLEQPEIHLHPNLQMQMADYFISLALSEKNVIIETHSDHIINRLVRRIIEDEDFELGKKIAIYFISNNVDGAIVEKVFIDEQKGILNWPNGFFDQTASEQEKIMMAGIQKRKLAREIF